ncbi:MAG: hypothetical protein A4E25_01771 [Methanobacterium sp. PtaB.Bin024]|nr:MAG: hypothetical protein A4E25_01771 [Methanobacterium sp. PtaB.Bin024]
MDELFKFFSDSDDKKLYLSEHIPLEFVFWLDSYVDDEYMVIYTTDLDKCPVCGSKIWKNGLEPLLINKIREINRQKFVCSNSSCNFNYTTNLEKNIDKGCNYTINTREKGLDMGLISYMSYENMAEVYEIYTGINIPRTTVYYHQKELREEYLDKIEIKLDEAIKKLGIEPSGVYGYDEQIFWIEREIFLRMTILDSETKLILNEWVISGKDFNKNTIEAVS